MSLIYYFSILSKVISVYYVYFLGVAGRIMNPEDVRVLPNPFNLRMSFTCQRKLC